MYQTIIVPIDLSNADKAKAMISVAAELGDENAHILLINIVEDVPGYIAAKLPSGLIEKSNELAREEPNGFVRTANLTTDIEVRTGKAHTGILALSEEKNADLIVLASN